MKEGSDDTIILMDSQKGVSFSRMPGSFSPGYPN
jgi:hypothetical protein